jgi:two-component system response regulator VanR
MRVLVVEDELYMAEAIRDGLRLEAIAADVAGNGDTALELLTVNAYDIAVLDRDIPGPSGDEIARRIVASGSGMPILMLTAADRLDDKTSGFELGADDYLTKPFELRELVLRLRALDRRRAHNRPPVRQIAGLRLDPFRREVYRDGRYVALTRKQFAVLEVLVAAEGGVVSAEELLQRAWDQNADPFTNAVRITVSALRKRLGEPWLITTVAGVGYRIRASPMPLAVPQPGRSPIGSRWKAAATSSANSPTPSTPCSRDSRRRSRSSRDSRPTPPTNCAPHWRSRRRFSRWLTTIRPATPPNSSTASRWSTPGPSTSPRHCSC